MQNAAQPGLFSFHNYQWSPVFHYILSEIYSKDALFVAL